MLHDGGARLLEFTARGDFAHEIFAELNKYAIAELPGMMLGVGSITDAGAASLYMALGANFIVTPVFREDIAIACNRKKVLWSPGCGSLTEIARVEELGCEINEIIPWRFIWTKLCKRNQRTLPMDKHYANRWGISNRRKPIWMV